METYSDVTFSHEGNVEGLVSELNELVNNFDIETKIDLLGENDDQASIHFMSGSSGFEIVEEIMNYALKKNIAFARGYIAGDEDPACHLYILNNGNLEDYDCDPGMFEYIYESEGEELPKSLEKAAELGPEKYFNEIYSIWSKDLKPIEGQQDYQEMIKSIISYSSEEPY